MTPTPVTPGTWENLMCSISNCLRKAWVVTQPHLTKKQVGEEAGLVLSHSWTTLATKLPFHHLPHFISPEKEGDLYKTASFNYIALIHSKGKSPCALTKTEEFWIRRGKIKEGCYRVIQGGGFPSPVFFAYYIFWLMKAGLQNLSFKILLVEFIDKFSKVLKEK